MVYIYHLECKKGCEIDYSIETDVKDFAKKEKPLCPICNKRIYQNDERTEIIGPKKPTPKYKQGKKRTIEEELQIRASHKKTTKRKKKKIA